MNVSSWLSHSDYELHDIIREAQYSNFWDDSYWIMELEVDRASGQLAARVVIIGILQELTS